MNRWLLNLNLLRRINVPLLLAVLALLVIGVMFVFSSCYVSDERPMRTLYERQIVWVVAGLVAHIVFAALDYRRIGKWSWWIYAVSLVLLVVVLFIGTRIYGARRWLMLFGIGVQPSELAKLAVIFALAALLGRPRADASDLRTLLVALLVVSVPVLLILKEPDLGTAMIFVPTAFVMMFVGGVPLRYLLGLAGLGVLVLGLALGAVFLPERLAAPPETQASLREPTGLSEHQVERIKTFFNADADPLGAGWNKMQSEIAVGSGGTWGKGFLKGTQNILGFLPRSVAPTDFIYSVIAEELGFVGSVMVLLLFGVVIGLGMQAAAAARDQLGRLLCTGVVTMVFCHVFINIAMTVGLMPITGLPLPLLSYGGSFMIITMSALGIVQSVHIRSRRVGLLFPA